MENVQIIVYRSSKDYLAHHGIKGQKWGVRRYENEDGTLTEEGKRRYAKAQIDASKYKTAKERMKTVAKSGLRGAAGGALFGLGAAGQFGEQKRVEQGKYSYYSPLKSLQVGLEYGSNANVVGILAGIGAVGSMAISGLYQGAQAIKVKRGQNFVKKYEEAFKKTYI